MIVLVGESASGKTTIQKELMKFGYKRLITYTTRPPRENERNGVDYYFVSEEKFREMIENGEFIEHSMYRKWHYGTAKRDIFDNKIAVLTPRGLRQFKKNTDINIISFYISVDRRSRMIKILQRGDDIEEAYRRNLSDVGQFDGIEDDVVYTISNDCYFLSAYDIAAKIHRLVLRTDEQKQE